MRETFASFEKQEPSAEKRESRESKELRLEQVPRIILESFSDPEKRNLLIHGLPEDKKPEGEKREELEQELNEAREFLRKNRAQIRKQYILAESPMKRRDFAGTDEEYREYKMDAMKRSAQAKIETEQIVAGLAITEDYRRRKEELFKEALRRDPEALQEYIDATKESLRESDRALLSEVEKDPSKFDRLRDDIRMRLLTSSLGSSRLDNLEELAGDLPENRKREVREQLRKDERAGMKAGRRPSEKSGGEAGLPLYLSKIASELKIPTDPEVQKQWIDGRLADLNSRRGEMSRSERQAEWENIKADMQAIDEFNMQRRVAAGQMASEGMGMRKLEESPEHYIPMPEYGEGDIEYRNLVNMVKSKIEKGDYSFVRDLPELGLETCSEIVRELKEKLMEEFEDEENIVRLDPMDENLEEKILEADSQGKTYVIRAGEAEIAKMYKNELKNLPREIIDKNKKAIIKIKDRLSRLKKDIRKSLPENARSKDLQAIGEIVSEILEDDIESLRRLENIRDWHLEQAYRGAKLAIAEAILKGEDIEGTSDDIILLTFDQTEERDRKAEAATEGEWSRRGYEKLAMGGEAAAEAEDEEEYQYSAEELQGIMPRAEQIEAWESFNELEPPKPSPLIRSLAQLTTLYKNEGARMLEEERLAQAKEEEERLAAEARLKASEERLQREQAEIDLRLEEERKRQASKELLKAAIEFGEYEMAVTISDALDVPLTDEQYTQLGEKALEDGNFDEAYEAIMRSENPILATKASIEFLKKRDLKRARELRQASIWWYQEQKAVA